MSGKVYTSIIETLDRLGVEYTLEHHEPTYTSEDSSRIRGTSMEMGAKALIVKVGKVFRLFVMSASLRLDTQKIKAHFSEKKIRFATPEEMMELTGLVPGSVPPFGEPILPFSLHIDPSILEQEMVSFNVGSLTDSITMRCEDWQKATAGEVVCVTKAAS